jgi:photosystem II stability/assembly factor-like uncharacterized protein
MRVSRFLLGALIAAVLRQPLPAQQPPDSSPSNPFKNLKYRSIGPAAGGRVARVAGIRGDPTTYYAATASGGVWKSTDGGVNWLPIFDDQPISSTGSIAVAPSDPNVVYVGSGEANIRGNVAAGNGIYKSTDAGKNWSQVWKQEGQIGTMVVHPKNSDIAYAAVLGHAFGPNPERGVYRTRDGGKSWVQVLKKDENTGASDVAVDPSNPNIVFAGFWQARRFPWDLQSGGPGSGLYLSRDGGDSWKQLSGAGLPGGIWGKVGVAVAPSDGRRVYVLIEADSGGLFRSEDGGSSYQRVSADRSIRQRPWYYSTMTVDPTNPDRVWFPQVPLLYTIDGGRSIHYAKGYGHGDVHDAWIDPANPKRMILGHDGGVTISLDGGQSWFSPALPIAQFYHVSTDDRVPYHIAGAMQDLGTAQGPSRGLGGGIHVTDWRSPGGGEAGHVVSAPGNPDIVYAGEYLGILTRYDDRTGIARNVSPWPENPSGWAGSAMRYRFQWTAPIAASPHDPRVIYYGGNVVFRTSDGGQTWTTISGDLTRNDPTKQQWTGGPITGDGTGVETYATVFALAESPRQKGLLWAGSDDGVVQLSRDAGASWTNVTAAMPGFPQWGTVSLIEPSPHDAATAYVVVDAHRLDDMRPYLYMTEDYGKNWKRLDVNLPKDVYVHAVREDPARRGLLYLGTERGVMYSADAGTVWRPLKLNLPTVAVHDLVVKDNDLILATHGRALWVLDDLTPVREMSATIADKPVHIFSIPDAVRWNSGFAWGRTGAAPNPPTGASITFALKAKPRGPVTLDILDSSGVTIRTLRSTPQPRLGIDDGEADAEAPKGDLPTASGIQRVEWDLRYEGAERIKGGKIDSGDPSVGPRVLPGRYTARLSADGQSATATVQVVQDPRTEVSRADLEAQLALALQARDDVTRLTRLVERLRALQSRSLAVTDRVGNDPRMAELASVARALATKSAALEARMHNPSAEVTYDILAMRGGAMLYSRLSPLVNWIGDGDGAPTQGMREVYAAQRKELAGLESEVFALVAGEVASINALAARLGLPLISIP